MSGTSTGRRVVGVISGIIVAIVIVGLIEAIGHRIFPLPPGMNLNDPEDLQRMINVMSPSAKSVVLGSWFLGAFVGGWVAMTIARWVPAPWIVAAIIVAGGIWSMVMIPHPLWMMAAGIALPLLAAVLVSRRTQIA